jgi:hypothetical protein
VVEHSIGNGEVDSSILSGSTSFLNEIKKQERRLVDSEPAIGICTQNKARSGVPNPCSLFVPRQPSFSRNCREQARQISPKDKHPGTIQLNE